MSNNVAVSVIIPAHGRSESLARCLQAMALQDYPQNRFDVIVVDDGSQTPLAEELNTSGGLSLTVIRQERAGPGQARNAGAARAQGQWLAFTDSDCRPAPDWLSRMEAALRANPPNTCLAGRTVNALKQNICAEASQLLISFLFAYYGNGREVRFFTSSNLACGAAPFRELGGFHPDFVLAAGEDRDLCDRWLGKGWPVRYVPEAVVDHYNGLTFARFCRQHFNYGRGAHTYHRLRRERGGPPLRPEPARFYTGMLRYPFDENGRLRAARISALLLVSQAANAAGYLVGSQAARRR